MIRVGVILEGDVEARFMELKQHYGLESSTDLIRFLISKQVEQLHAGDRKE